MPSIDAALALLFAAFPLMGSPGPATLSMAAASAAFGPRRASPYWAGLICGVAIVILAIAAGLTGLILAIPFAAPIVTVVAAAYILYLAWRIAMAPPLGVADVDAPPPSFLAGFLLNLANPKAYAAIGAAYSSATLAADSPALDAAWKTALLIGAAVVVKTVWLTLGASLSALLRSQRLGRALNIAFAALLVVSVVLAVAPRG